MRLMAITMLCVLSVVALADPVRTDPSPDVTVFTDSDGAHVVTLVAPSGIFGTPPIRRVMSEQRGGKTHLHRALAGQANAWVVRTRVVDGRLICEKFAERPHGETAQAELAAELFKESCS